MVLTDVGDLPVLESYHANLSSPTSGSVIDSTSSWDATVVKLPSPGALPHPASEAASGSTVYRTLASV